MTELLPDEAEPKRLALSFPESFTLRMVQDVDWAGTRNGLLPQRAAAEGFDAHVTVDRGIEHQQNVSEVPIPVVIMLAHRNRLAELQPLAPYVASLFSDPLENRIYRVPD